MARRKESQFSQILKRLIGKENRKRGRCAPPAAKRSLRAEQLEARRVFAGFAFDSVILASAPTSSVYSPKVAVDNVGNTYMGGNFTGQVDFDLSGTHPGDSDILVARGRGDGFVAKYGPDNALVWARRFGGDAVDSILQDSVNDVEVDSAGNVYISGSFADAADFGGFNLIGQGGANYGDAYVAKLDSSGTFVWVNAWGTSLGESATSIAIDSSGRLTALGQGYSSSPAQLSVRQFDSAGNQNWIHDHFSVSDSVKLYDLQADQAGNIFIVGGFNGTVDLDPGPNEFLATGTDPGDFSFYNTFVSKLSSSGDFQWSTQFLADDLASKVSVGSVVIDDDGSVITVGRHIGQVSIVEPVGSSATFPETASSRTFFTRIDSSGSVISFASKDWLLRNSLPQIVSTPDGFFASLGLYDNELALSPGVTLQADPARPAELAYVELTKDFGVVSAISASSWLIPTGLASDVQGNVYASSWVTESIDYDPNPNVSYFVNNPVNTGNNADASIVKFRPIKPGDEVLLLEDSFEVSEWNGLWVEDIQNDWFRSSQRSTTGTYSAEVDGSASNATLTTANVIDLSGMQSATLTFDWLIESGFDAGEYLTLDISTNGGASWIQDVRRLNGNVSAENFWHSETVDLTPHMSANTKIRYRAKVSASDEDANVDNVRIVGIADGPNVSPLANAGGSYSMNEGGSVTLSGAGSSDPDGSVVSYAWDFNGDGIYDDASGMSPTFSTTASETKTIGLLVTDNRGATATATTTVLVNNVAPTANAGNDVTGSIGQPITLSAAGSSDPGQDIESYQWDLDGDGFYDDASGISAIFTSAVVGVFTVGLQVTDADGAVGFDSLTITVTSTPVLSTKFYVVDDASTNRTFEYAADGAAVENYGLNSGNTAPRGAASTVAGDKVWVVDANKKVYVYNEAGGLLGSWTAGSLASKASVQGIATNGVDVWLVDAAQDRVYRYANAAGRLSGSQNATSSFALNSGNRNPKDIVTDGTHLWVVNDNTTDKVFKYTMTGALVGSWTISSVNSKPTGITIDPSGASQSIWIVDNGTDRVYEYTNARSLNSGSQAAATSFALAAGNGNPQGIADPPVSVSNQGPIVQLESDSSNDDRAFVDQPSNRPPTLGRERLWVQPSKLMNNRLSSFVQDSVTEQIAPHLTPSRENVAPQRLDLETLWTGSRLFERLDHSSSSQSKATTIKLHGERLRGSLLVAAVDDVFAAFA